MEGRPDTRIYGCGHTVASEIEELFAACRPAALNAARAAHSVERSGDDGSNSGAGRRSALRWSLGWTGA